MKREPHANLSASVRQRLLNRAKEEGDDFQRILVRFALERLLYRISLSGYAARFYLKGALLLLVWMDEPHRRTKDLDLLGLGNPTSEELAAIFQELCRLEVEPDGLRFEEGSVRVREIREENIYGGVRVTLTAYLDQARIPLQIDVGFGDRVVPPPEFVTFPVLLEFPAPNLRAYTRETVIAEKLSALIALDLDNSRLKDFFDLWTFSQQFDFDGEVLAKAIDATLSQRRISLPLGPPTGLTSKFSDHPGKLTQWRAFVQQSLSPALHNLSLPEVVSAVADFLLPVLKAIDQEDSFHAFWYPGGPWRPKKRADQKEGEL
jgi:hypothetical protein